MSGDSEDKEASSFNKIPFRDRHESLEIKQKLAGKSDPLYSTTSVHCMLAMHQNGLLRVLVVALGLSEPSEKGFGRLADLLAGGKINILLACLRAPFSDNFFADKILIVVDAKDLRDLT